MVKLLYAAALLMAVASAGSPKQLCPDDSATPVPAPTSKSPVPAPTTVSPAPTTKPVPGKRRTLIVGHRGASGYRPDHTIESYTLAIEMGADYIEPDLVITKDGVLIARHEPNIIGTTDVSSRPEFADRKKTIKVDGVEEAGFFVSDFTLAEIKTLRAIQPMADRDQSFNGKFLIPTFEEVIELAQRKAKEIGRPIGIYPETKHPTYHQQLGLPLEDKLLATLTKYGWNDAQAPVIIQSFEPTNLRELRKKTKVQLAQLVDGGDWDPKTGTMFADTRPYDWVVAGRNGTNLDLLTPAGLKEVASYANIVAPWKRYLVNAVAGKIGEDGKGADANGDGKVTDADYKMVPNQKLFDDAHAAGLKVHTWTFRDESYRLGLDYKGDPAEEYIQFFKLGLDGLFSDHAKSAVEARKKYEQSLA
ncbi:hypothetical protein ATCC90586_003852 [Pythium insidiosum]|nr:hypothetical protein ATCC90586_003852 [Pythium insidiosum]